MKIPIDPVKLVPLLSVIYRLWIKTLRYEVHGEWASLVKENESGEAFTIAFWHGELFPIFGFANKVSRNFVAVVSASKDGEIAAKFFEKFGHATVRGSSSKGGVRALLQAKRIMAKENRMAVFAVDGPRGPRHKPKDGVIFLSQRAGARIIPARVFSEKKKVFNSWDKFELPMPFSKCKIYIGEPMAVTTEKLNKELIKKERERLEGVLNSLGAEDRK